MFRGKESSNRVKLSQLVQELLNFVILGSLQLWGWGVVGGCPPHTCTCMHTHIHIKHHNFNCKWQPPLGEFLGIPYDVICTRMCMRVHACAHVWVAPPNHPHPIHPPPRGTPGISQNSIALEQIEIFQFHLKI